MSWVSRFSSVLSIRSLGLRKCRWFHWRTSKLCHRCAQYDSEDCAKCAVFLSLSVRMFEWYCICDAVYLCQLSFLHHFLNLIVFLSSTPFLFIFFFLYILPFLSFFFFFLKFCPTQTLNYFPMLLLYICESLDF